jgi:monofunctional biosynthetic peptidoglycan transglycosylase
MLSVWIAIGRLLGLLIVCTISLQLYFLLRVGMMVWIDPHSTSFQRSEIWRILGEKKALPWSQEWVADERISVQLKRAVIASEDAGFTQHPGVEWDAVEKAWERNQKAEARVEKLNEQIAQREAARKKPAAASAPRPTAKLVGGSTITQQLAKNLFLSGERTVLRKAEELVITYMLEALLSKRRILEIYLNQVEWGEGLFGAQAAARHYFRIDAAQLSAAQAARLAVMLPAPKRFQQRPASPYVLSRTATVMARMGAVTVPGAER